MSRSGRGGEGQRYYLYDSELHRPPPGSRLRGHGHGQPSSSSSRRLYAPSSMRTRSHHHHHDSSPHRDKVSRNPPESRSPDSPAGTEEGEKKEREYDLSIPMEPLSHFVDDPRRLLREAMTILGHKRLNAMIPPSLKTMGRRNLEFFCLEVLESMSKATLLNILEGKESKNAKDSPPHSHSSEDKSPSGAEAVDKFKNKLKKALVQETVRKREKRKKKKDGGGGGESEVEGEENPGGKKSKKEKKKAKKKAKKKQKKEQEAPPPEANAGSVIPGQKTLMELLELEYRAKAIKALLRTQGLDASSKIDAVLSMDAPPASPSPLSTEQPPPPPMELNSNNDPGTGTGPSSGEPETVALPSSTSPGVKVQSPDSSNVHLATEQDADPSPLGLTSPLSMSSPEQVTSSVQNEEPPHSMGVEEVDDEEEVEGIGSEEEAELGDEDDVDEEEEDDVFVVPPPFKSMSERESTPPMSPLPRKEVEDGEIDSDAEEEDLAINSVPLSSRRFMDEEESSEEETAIWSKRPCLDHSSNSSDSEDSALERRAWARDRRREEDMSKDKEKEDGALSDVSLVDLADSEEEGLKRVSSPEGDELEKVSEEEKSQESGSPLPGPMPAQLEDLDDLPIITEDGSVIFPKDVESEGEEEAPSVRRGGGGEEEEEDTPLTWYHRWYKSKKVQRVVKANKVYGNLRSKLRKEKQLPVIPPANLPLNPEPEVSIPIIGSIQEYEKLFGKPEKAPPPEEEATPSGVQEPCSSSGLAPITPMEEEEEEEEEEGDEDLWGDILGQKGEDSSSE